MSEPELWLLLLGFAVVVDGLLAGASLDQSIKQLPARHRIEMRAFSEEGASDPFSRLAAQPAHASGLRPRTAALAIAP
jgi:hypothetical protein